MSAGTGANYGFAGSGGAVRGDGEGETSAVPAVRSELTGGVALADGTAVACVPAALDDGVARGTTAAIFSDTREADSALIGSIRGDGLVLPPARRPMANPAKNAVIMTPKTTVAAVRRIQHSVLDLGSLVMSHCGRQSIFPLFLRRSYNG